MLKTPESDLPDSPDEADHDSVRWTRWHAIGSIAIALHLIAIVLAPASVPPSSSAARQGWTLFRPYLEVGYLNHGYHYFAPDPGASSLLEYTAIKEDGERVWGRIPDRKTIWPRLLYHRHFMLTEYYGGLPPDATDLKNALAASFAAQLMREHDASSIELSHVVHQLSTREEILDGGVLDAPEKYETTPLGTYELAAVNDGANDPEGVASISADAPSIEEAAPLAELID
ncbi:MAG: hypothetical protein AAFU85_24710 [Planctomycetota bacterium]